MFDKSRVPSEISGTFPKRAFNVHKRQVGIVSVVGGSSHYIHAPVITGLGSRAAGAGLVQLVVPDASRIASGALLPEATFTKLTQSCVPPRADVCVAGMGLGMSVSSEVTISRLLSGSSGRFVLDADALNVLALWYAKNEGYDPVAGQEIVLTPHVGEAARLLGCNFADVTSDRVGAAREIADRYGATVVLKSEKTIVVSMDGAHLFENVAGNPFMALGGMGDLLAGVIAARWAYLKGDPFLAASSAVWLHSQASDNIVNEMRDPSIANTAAEIGSLRVQLEVQGA